MNQGRILLRGAHVLIAGCAVLAASYASAQTAPRPGRTRQPSDVPNRAGEADAAAGTLVDSLFEPFAPPDPLADSAARALGSKPTRAVQPKWSAKLARNPNPGDGNSPYVLIDRYGGIQRYVEPVKQIDLNAHLGQVVTVRRDTGGTLLASQLELPRTAPRAGGNASGVVTAGATAPVGRSAARKAGAVNGAAPQPGVRLAAQHETLPALTPTPADDAGAAMPLADGAPMPMGEIVQGQPVDGQVMGEGPMMYEGGYEGSHDGSYEEGYQGEYQGDPLYLDGQSEMGTGSCTVCGDGVCGGRGCLGGCGFGSRPIFYARGEYLLWQFDGMPIPPLVVRGEVNNNGTPGNPADDFFDNAFVVYGGNDVLDEARSGGRITLGYFLDDYGKLGIEADYLAFGKIDTHFEDGGDGVSPIVGRPFTDATTGLPAVEDVSFPGIQGTVSVDIDSEFQSAGVRIRRNLCCIAGCTTGCGDAVTCGSGVGGCDGCTSCGSGAGASCPMCPLLFGALGKALRGGTRHVDVLYGVRWARLNERLHVNEDLIADDDTTFVIDDDFKTQNQFFGGEIGFLVDWQKNRWSVDFLSKLAIGNTQQKAAIAAQTVRDDQVFPNIGLLAQPSNVGNYDRDEFSVMPEIGLTGGYAVTERLRITVGYTLLYWTRVLRPGDQIDPYVNPDWLILAATPEDQPDPSTIQPQSPSFAFRDTDIWAQGLNVGLDYRW